MKLKGKFIIDKLTLNSYSIVGDEKLSDFNLLDF